MYLKKIKNDQYTMQEFHLLPELCSTQEVSPYILRTLDALDPESVGLQGQCPAHDSCVCLFCPVQIGQGLMVRLKHKLPAIQVRFVFLYAPNNGQSLLLHCCI